MTDKFWKQNLHFAIYTIFFCTIFVNTLNLIAIFDADTSLINRLNKEERREAETLLETSQTALKFYSRK